MYNHKDGTERHQGTGTEHRNRNTRNGTQNDRKTPFHGSDSLSRTEWLGEWFPNHDSLLYLSFLDTHREDSVLTSDVPAKIEGPNQFRSLWTVSLDNLSKGSVGLYSLIVGKLQVSVMRVSIPSTFPLPFIPLHHFLRSHPPPPFLVPSLVLTAHDV